MAKLAAAYDHMGELGLKGRAAEDYIQENENEMVVAYVGRNEKVA